MSKVKNKKNNKKIKKSRYANTVSLRDENGDIFYVTESEYDRIRKRKEEEKELQQLEKEYLQQQEQRDNSKEEENNIITIMKKYFNNVKQKIIQ